MRFLLMLSLTLCLVSFGKSLPNGYVVVSEVYDASLPVDSCKISGIVSLNSQRLSGAVVATLDGKNKTYTDSTGYYELMIPAKDTALFMFKSRHQEVIIWNYNFKPQHHITINFYPSQDWNVIEVDKPVVYLYSEKDLTAEVTVNFKGELSFTYPPYEDKWIVQLKDNQLYCDNKPYPYLFWEGEMDSLDFVYENNSLPAFIVESTEVVDFMDESLSQMGLNDQEKTDFITFWAPQMLNEPYQLIQFLPQKELNEQLGELEVVPEPDHLFRLFMVYQSFDAYPAHLHVVPQEFEKFDREGFSVLEWGGSELKQSLIKI